MPIFIAILITHSSIIARQSDLEERGANYTRQPLTFAWPLLMPHGFFLIINFWFVFLMPKLYQFTSLISRNHGGISFHCIYAVRISPDDMKFVSKFGMNGAYLSSNQNMQSIWLLSWIKNFEWMPITHIQFTIHATSNNIVYPIKNKNSKNWYLIGRLGQSSDSSMVIQTISHTKICLGRRQFGWS